MATTPIDNDLEAELKRRGVWPLSDYDRQIPDEWLALLDHLHGQPEREASRI